MKKVFCLIIGYGFTLTSSFASTESISGIMTGNSLKVEVNRCAQIMDDESRLQCYDNLSDIVESPNRQREPDKMIQAAETSSAAVDINNPSKKGHWLGIEPYRRNYVLPITYNENVNEDLYTSLGEQLEIDNTEIKFQFSFQLPIWENLLDNNLDIYIAYTQLSFFQAYNYEYSRPFRETVYEPELGFRWQPDLNILGWNLESVHLAYNHQSNGKSKPLSRSWDRLIGQFRMNKDSYSLGMRVWNRIDSVPIDDDNPDIDDYLGYGELYLGYDVGRNRLALMLRNPFDKEAIQLDWTYLFSEKVGFYVQYFNGYGESLLDYNHRVNRIGIGFMLNEWL